MTDKFPSDWSITSLGACSSWHSGGTPNTSVAAYWNGDIPWITASSLHEFYIRDSERRVTQVGLENGTRLMPMNSILFVVRGMSLKTEFRVGIARRPVAFGQDCKAIVANNGIDPLYLANVLRAKSQDILALVDEASHGTGRLQTSALQRLEIPVPPYNEQYAIAHILGSLDDKIELNRQMNATLEAIARAIFKSWFVDFDPVRANRGELDTSLPPDLLALFPDEFVESELGLIPAGWKPGTFGEIARNLRRNVNPDDLPPHTPYIGLGHMPQRSVALTEWGKAQEVSSTKRQFQEGEILFGKLRPYFHKVGIAPIDGICSTDIVVVMSRQPRWYGFSLCHLSSVKFIDYTTAVSTGTKMPRTKWRDMARYQIVVPPKGVVVIFNQLVESLFKKIQSNILESRTLAELRDTLLPNLVSGELRVPSALGSLPKAIS